MERMPVMAKDKGKKPKKSTATDSEFARPSDAPAGGDAWKFEDEANVGKLFMITPLREQDFTSDLYGTSQIIVADIVELNEKKPEKSEEHSNVYVFGGWTKGALRGYVGERIVVARLEQDQAKSKSKNPAWVLVDADDDDIAVARAYRAAADPLAANNRGKASGDEPKADKKKKSKK